MTRPSARTAALSADTWRVEDLVKRVAQGRITTPFFQRQLKWTDEDRIKLFDSILHGYPVGTILLQKRAATGRASRLGPLRLPGPTSGDIYEIVDGQQRIHAFASEGLNARGPDQRPIYYDLEQRTFGAVPRNRRPAAHWLLVHTALDSARLVAWLVEANLPKNLQDEAIESAKALREYDVPIYVLETNDPSIAREVFRRTNRTGHSLEESDVFDAIFATHGPRGASSISGIVRAIEQAGFGEIDRETVLRSLYAILGKDPLRATADNVERKEAKAGFARTRDALLLAVDMMRESGFPHISLVPYSLTLVMLAAFFDRFPETDDRTRTLLRRWIWRGALNAQHRGDVAPIRRALNTIRTYDESEAASRLAEEMARTGPVFEAAPVMDPASTAHASTKILVAAMLAMRPHHLVKESELKTERLFGADSGAPFVELTSVLPSGLRRSLANRLLHPPLRSDVDLIEVLTDCTKSTLESHALDLTVLALLRRSRFDDAIERRGRLLGERLDKILAARAEWEQSDRPSLESLAAKSRAAAEDEAP